MLIAKYDWGETPDGRISITFHNCLTGTKETRYYRTLRGANCAVTKFGNKRILEANKIRDSRIEVHTPLDYDD